MVDPTPMDEMIFSTVQEQFDKLKIKLYILFLGKPCDSNVTSLFSLSSKLICAARLIVFKQVIILSTQFL